MKLELGKYYRAKNNDVWCCFRIDTSKQSHAQADCILTEGNSSRVEYFYLDGRYDSAGQREHCLVEEVPAGTKGSD